MQERTLSDQETRSRSNPVDIHVGNRVRGRRKALGVSQGTLAEALGLTFQQVQKYERGSNRVSASKLYRIAGVLQVPVAYFFEGLEDPEGPSPADGADRQIGGLVETLMATDGGAELAEAFTKIPPGPMRRRLVALVHTIVGEAI